MTLRLVQSTLLLAASVWAQAPVAELKGRWDGTIQYGGLAVPFTIFFEGSGKALKGSFVNGESRVSSSSGSFENGSVRLMFEQLDRKFEGSLNHGELAGKYGDSPFKASAYCTCAFEGEAGPDISGKWRMGDTAVVTVRRKGEDTLAVVSRAGVEMGPLTGRFDGLTFTLHYFDGVRGAVLEMEQKNGAWEMVWKEPGKSPAKYTGVRAE